MRNKCFIALTLILVLLSNTSTLGQEVAKVRTTKYTINLNQIKHQEQVDAVVAQTKDIENVTECELDWLNYKMQITVNEGGNYGSFSLEKIKAILIENNVTLIKFTKETISN